MFKSRAFCLMQAWLFSDAGSQASWHGQLALIAKCIRVMMFLN